MYMYICMYVCIDHLGAAMGLTDAEELRVALDREPARPRLPVCDHLLQGLRLIGSKLCSKLRSKVW